MQPETKKIIDTVFKFVNTNIEAKGIDFGCGSAPVGFDLALRGHSMDFIDIDGAGAYEFTKWRANKRNLNGRVGWKWGGPYDYALFLDSLEHINDYDNNEHLAIMDKKEVMSFLVNMGVYPLNEMVFIKRDLTLGGKVS